MASLPSIAIIGSGIIGLSSAWHLARAGCSVTIFDANRESSEASWSAAGTLAPHNEADAATSLWSLCKRGLERWQHFAEALAPHESLDLHRSGCWLPCSHLQEQQQLSEKIERLRAAGVQFTWWESKALAEKEPALNPRLIGAYAVDGGHVDPRQVCHQLGKASRALGAERQSKVQVRCISGPELQLDGGKSIGFDHIVLAAGAWTPQLEKLAGFELKSEPVKGQMLRFSAHPGCRLRRFLHSGSTYAVQRQDGSIVVASTMENTESDQNDDEHNIAKSIQGAKKLLPHLELCEVEETWTGLWPRLNAGQPLFKRVNERLTIATGHFRNGVLLTPISGEIVRDLVLEGRSETLEQTLLSENSST